MIYRKNINLRYQSLIEDATMRENRKSIMMWRRKSYGVDYYTSFI